MKEKRAKPKKEKQTADNPAPIRLNKFIANAGLSSRRGADVLIEQGVVKVNGKVETSMGVKVLPSDVVEVNGKRISSEKKAYILLNKPRNAICTRNDEKGRRTVMDLLPKEYKHLYPVGRLDRNTTGILLLTNDGDLSQKLLHPSKKVIKVYKAKLEKRLSQTQLNDLVQGIDLEDGVSKFDKIVELNEDEAFRYGIEIHSGKNRIIRRMIEAVDNQVIKLDRVLFGTFEKRGIKQGEWRPLREKELKGLGLDKK